MPMDRATMRAVCRAQGHDIFSLMESEAVEPRSGILVPQMKILCRKCGGNLEEISLDVRARKEERVVARLPKRRSNAEPEPTLPSPPPPMSSGAEEELA
jgi:hypothetical protein